MLYLHLIESFLARPVTLRTVTVVTHEGLVIQHQELGFGASRVNSLL